MRGKQIWKRLLKNNTDNNTNIDDIKDQLNEPLKKLSALLEKDTIKVSDLITGYEGIESNYKNFIGSSGIEMQPLLATSNKETDIENPINKLIYWIFAIIIIQTIFIGLIAFLIFKKISGF